MSAATFTIDEYEHMIACGAFNGANVNRIELIRGELRMMSPQGAEHGELVTQLDDWSHEAVERNRVKIRIQSSVEIPQIKHPARAGCRLGAAEILRSSPSTT